ncbi:tail completion protein gp17 [Pseudorhodoferax soli]|uniref:Uncharacterized protein DUF3168 n=1 Tax=Pseudorhodoferax soli TaxID=545864 RepID=A0A368Y0G0_9BURK|nr:DUF3168 domain-containing protein [Pseudorhodoferax soli]RCW73810.1 uncharacterized protein DUF3168 [Pseudorhodoferax soli]
MNNPPIFKAVNVPAVQAHLRALRGPLRFYAFGMAPQDVQYPYAVWRTAAGTPGNTLARRPDHDAGLFQIDVYAKPSQGVDTVRAVAHAIRDAIEGHAHLTAWRGESIDPQTKNFHVGFDVSWIVFR